MLVTQLGVVGDGVVVLGVVGNGVVVLSSSEIREVSIFRLASYISAVERKSVPPVSASRISAGM